MARDRSRSPQSLPLFQIPGNLVFRRAFPDSVLAAAISPVVRRLYTLYGPVAVTAGDDTHPPTTCQATLTPEYQAMLAEADKLAVRVGGNLSLRCVVFAKQETTEIWLLAHRGVQIALVPALQDTCGWYAPTEIRPNHKSRPN